MRRWAFLPLAIVLSSACGRTDAPADTSSSASLPVPESRPFQSRASRLAASDYSGTTSAPKPQAETRGSAAKTLPFSFDGNQEIPLEGAGTQVAAAPAGKPVGGSENLLAQASAGVAFRGEDFITDIIRRDPASGDYDSLLTSVHEATHHINRQIRAERGASAGIGLYVGGGRAFWMEEPRASKRGVDAFVPEFARRLGEMRYHGYIAKDEHGGYFWNLFDEWSAYVNEAQAAVIVAPKGSWRSRGSRSQSGVDAVDGAADFLVFCAAAGAAISRQDPDYFRRQPEFRAMFAAQAERTAKWVAEGLEAVDGPTGTRPYAGNHAGRMMRALAGDPQAEPLRAWMREVFGAQWTSRTLNL